ncbi:hypothetical protein Trydic_g3561 [Trypoxylus dichotomus]
MDNLGQYSGINNLRFYGIPERPDEDANQLVVDSFRRKLNIQVQSQDIDVVHRLMCEQTRRRESEAQLGPMVNPGL